MNFYMKQQWPEPIDWQVLADMTDERLIEVGQLSFNWLKANHHTVSDDTYDLNQAKWVQIIEELERRKIPLKTVLQ